MKDAGFSGVLLFDMGARGPKEAVPPAGPAFLGPEWLAQLKETLADARRLGLQVDMSVASSWDMGGPWIEPPQAVMGLYPVETVVQAQRGLAGSPSGINIQLPFPPIPGAAPMAALGVPAFWKDVAVLAVMDARRAPGHDFVFQLDLTGAGDLREVVLDQGDPGASDVVDTLSPVRDFTVALSDTGCPSILSAGRTSQEDYERMWASIKDKGYWQGEIWDRRKDGGIYPKWLSISVIRNDEGDIRYHIAHFTDISAERASEAKIHYMAHHDMLTGLNNRFSLMDRLEHALSVARRQAGRVALLFIDLDRFKLINDTLGHHIGDELLIHVSQRLRQCVRESDLVARLGGDEFVVMLSGIEHSAAVAMVAEKLLLSIGESYAIGPHTLYTTPSIGIAIYPLDGEDGETLMRNADAAMYHAKSAGRNNFQFFDARMNEAALERLGIEHALRLALGRDEFRLHYQPIIDLNSGRVAGVEALVRWQHPERGLLAPGTFIGVAEETGLIQPIGDWVMWAACRQLADFRAAGLDGIKMAINISAIQMRNGNLSVLARGVIEAYSLPPGDLVFEITESVAMEQPEETIRMLDLLRDMGITLALDDFGTGYSSLSYLRMFALDKLKLDRSFVQDIGQDMDGQVICDATIGLAHNLGLTLVAEGVETQEQLDYLQARGCDLVQGYLFSKPLPAEQVVEFIRQRNG